MLDWKIMILLFLLLQLILGSPMLYKKNENDKYERDLVPISSTVIPLTSFKLSSSLHEKPNEEYKMAFLKKLRKKVKHEDQFEDPDTLITITNNKKQLKSERN